MLLQPVTMLKSKCVMKCVLAIHADPAWSCHYVRVKLTLPAEEESKEIVCKLP